MVNYMSELKIFNNHKILICCFGGMSLQFGGILPFEFLNYLKTTYIDNCDLLFYIDKNQCWYHKGIEGITNNITETICYLNNIFKSYEKVICMGISAGGYASILFGSLCNNVNNVISFIPQTILKNPINNKFKNLKQVINNKTSYILYGDANVRDKNDLHHISHILNLQKFVNINIIIDRNIKVKDLRDNGTIKRLLDNIIIKKDNH